MMMLATDRRGTDKNGLRTTGCWLPLALAAALGTLGSCDAGRPGRGLEADPIAAGPWRDLFDGKTLAGWTVPQSGASGNVYVRGGAVHMEMGNTATGITYDGEPPREDYEIELEGMRVDGNDFWCGLTFPVGSDPITLVLGGWGGTVVGLSCLDGKDASENETSQVVSFDDNRWYRVRVRVTKARIQCWLDGRRIIDVARRGRKITIRPEVDLSVPLGIATWETHGAVRRVRLRLLSAREAGKE